MLTISTENAKAIRTPFEVHCGMSYREDGNDLTFSISGTPSAVDSNISSTLDAPEISMRILTDLAGNGFPLNGQAQFNTGAAGSYETGKIGVRTAVGGSVTITCNGSKTINSLTIAITEGSGTITYGGVSYSARRIVVVPINAASGTIVIKADDGVRICLASIVPGINLEFDNDNLISCTLALRSSVDILDSSWQVSDIELTAYYPDDIGSAIGNMGDDVPITYYAGYSGDYSDVRTFYLSEKATQQDGVITIKGEDKSAKLEEVTFPATISGLTQKDGKKGIYNLLVSAVRKGIGEKFPITVQSAPSSEGSSTTKNYIGLKEQTCKDVVSSIMQVSHVSGYYPAFIDAGIPTIRWSEPSVKWDIYEEDVAELTIEYDRNINAIISSGENDIQTKLTFGKKETLDETTVKKASTKKTVSFDTYVLGPSVSNATIISATALSVYYKSKKKGKCKTTGKEGDLTTLSKQLTYSRAGITAEIDPSVDGVIRDGNGSILYPKWYRLFELSNKSGQFTFKGDPRMQPRDLFRFHRLDGTVEVCTIGTITLSHEGGGTSAEIEYRNGVL